VPAELVAIGDGPIEAQLLPGLGARLHRLRAFGHDLLRTPDDPETHAEDPFRWGAYIMAPWCNRIAAVPTEVEGRTVDLASNFPDGSAIHGQVYGAEWRVVGDGSLATTGGGSGWPWRYRCSMRATVHGARLSLELALTNLANGPMPGGLGLHPWFRRPIELRIPSAEVIPSNVDPDASVEPVAGRLDLRSLGPVPDDLDATWLATADPSVELRWPEIGIRAVMEVRASVGTCVVVASPATLDAVAVEAQTHAPQGLRRYLDRQPGALHLLSPGAAIELTVELLVEQATPA
jgi:aldose 1-epimerase